MKADEIGREKLLLMYRTMLTIRAFDEQVHELYGAARLVGYYHLYIGEEAVATGVCAALRPDDFITSTHRGHGHLIAKGGDVRLMFAEILGKREGYCKAKGGSMHIADISLGILGANGIVGAGLPIATGAGYSCRLRGTDQVAVAFFGDGASNQGAFHEAINMASAWKLPVIYVCENNLYGVSTSFSRVVNIQDVAVRAQSYNIPGAIVDGMDVIAVYRAATQAVQRARNGEGPTLLECKTYRFHVHNEGEIATYRTNEEVERWRQNDPIPNLRTKLMTDGLATAQELGELANGVNRYIEDALAFAERGTAPAPEEALEDVFSPF